MKARNGGLAAALLAAAFATATFADGVVYQNDFATRTSAGAVPYGGWRSVNYVAGQLLANTNFELATMFDYDDLQDNWIKASNNCKNNAYVDNDDGNYVARLGDSLNEGTSGTRKTGPHVIIRQRIGNRFTNGTVTVTFDMLPPSAWYFHSSDADYLRVCRFHLGDESAYWDTPGAANSIFRIGAAYKGSLNGRRVVYRDGESDETVVSNVVVTSGNWLRYVATVNLDSRKWRFSCYDLGATHPTLDTPTPLEDLLYESRENLEFYGSSVTSVSTILLDGYAILAGNSAARYDNIRIAHNGVECYVNDFNTRKSRSLAASATLMAYSAEDSVVDEFTYETTNKVIGTVSEVGYDGWKRRHSGGSASLSLSGNSRFLSFAKSSYGWAAHPIGMTATNGTLKFRCDLYSPKEWTGSENTMQIALGDDNFYNDNSGAGTFASNGEFMRAGITAKTAPGTNTFYRGGASTSNVRDTNTSIPTSTWIRVVITAHIDGANSTFDYAFYRQSGNNDGAADGTLLSSGTGIESRYRDKVQSITCFAVSSYGGDGDRFDNIRIWYTPEGESEEHLIYQNSFDTRRIYRLDESVMTGTLKSNPTGMDGWTRLGASGKNVLLSSDGNAALSFGDGDETYATAVHDLGGEYRGGEMKAQADICAPTSWQDTGGCANVWFGGDQYHEGNLNGGEYNYEKMAAFGFGITNTTFAAFQGNRVGGGEWVTDGAATTGHWYRFLVLSENRTSAVLVYDMGTEQPTLATAVPETPVAGFSDLPFRRNVAISCVGVSAMGVKNPAWSHLLPSGADARLKIDNISFAHDPSGAVIVIR